MFYASWDRERLARLNAARKATVSGLTESVTVLTDLDIFQTILLELDGIFFL